MTTAALDMDPELMARLRPAKVGVPAFGSVVDQDSGQVSAFDPEAICPTLQNTILEHFSEPLRDDDDFTRWLLVVASRQTGKTATAVLSEANAVEYTPGAFGLLMTDKRDRSHTVFRYASLSVARKPAEVAYPTTPSSKDTRQITWKHGGKFACIGANDDNPGIGMAADFLVMSELPFWNDPAGVWSQLSPAFRNRKNAIILMESTPAPMSEPGAEWFRDMADEAASGHGRMDFLFVPFYASKLNERTWKDDWHLTNDEIRLLERFGPPTGLEPVSAPGDTTYLTLENLAFLRTVIHEDNKIKQNPELLWVWYPKDRVSCWQLSGNTAFPLHALERHERTLKVPWPNNAFYLEYEDPEPGAVYVIAGDPSGYGTGDPASFIILKVWADEWKVVAEYETNQHDPTAFAYHYIKAANRYNDAIAIVEANGVGAGPLTLLDLAGRSGGVEVPVPGEPHRRESLHLKHLYYRKIGDLDAKPGIWASTRSIEEAMTATVDGLLERTIIPSEALYAQLRTYRRDKEVAQSETARILDPNAVGRRRRPKHHWDRVSAFMWACWGAKFVAPVRFKPRVETKVEEAERPRLTLALIDEQRRANREIAARVDRAASGPTRYSPGTKLRRSNIKPSR